jgi:hypothetical protein
VARMRLFSARLMGDGALDMQPHESCRAVYLLRGVCVCVSSLTMCHCGRGAVLIVSLVGWLSSCVSSALPASRRVSPR